MDSARMPAVETLLASWSALVLGCGGSVEPRDAFVAARCRHPVWNNAVLLAPETGAIPAITRFYAELALRWALWTGDPETSEVASASGMVRAGGTTDMARALNDLPPSTDVGLVVPCDLTAVAEINGLSADVVDGVRGFDAYRTSDGAAGLLAFRKGDDVQLSLVATRAEHRRRGLATALITAALHEAGDRGAKTASLQANPEAVSLYERLGFRMTGEWLEWVIAP